MAVLAAELKHHRPLQEDPVMTVQLRRVFVALFVLSATAPAMCGAQALPEPPAQRFKALDVNHDGVVSQYEYDGDAALAALDSDHNDQITASELQGVLGEWEGGPQSAERRISLADLNRDGKLSDDELRPAMDLRFKLMDKNKDGNIDLDELQTGFGVPMLHRGRN